MSAMLSIFGYLAFASGACLSLLNFYLSFIRVPLLRALGRSPRFISGFPLIGSLLLVVSAALLCSVRWLTLSALALAALDTGGLHWLLGLLVWEAMADRSRGGDST